MKRLVLFVLIVLLPISGIFAAASKEAASSGNRGRYLSGMGYIIPPGEIQIDSYISQYDYDYPLPKDKPVNTILEVDRKDDVALLMVGLKGKKEPFNDLPPLNISFVIDRSGSMSERDKMTWVKDSFDIFIDNIRAKDYVSLVIFDDRSEVLYRPTQIKNYQDKEKFRSTVRGVNPRGSTNIYDGLALGYRQVEANYNEEYINRVILLTDGIHNAGEFRRDDIKDLAARYNQRGITVSAIALGASADIPLMVDLAVLGGGSSRFISDHEKMVETFGSEIDRLLVPAARMVRMRIELPEGVKLKETWGYQHRVSGNTIYYSLDSIHNGDYETLVAEVVSSDPRQVQFGNFYIEYTDMYGKAYDEGPHPFVLPVKEGRTLTNERVIKADGYITLGRGLIDLGNEAKEINDLQREYVPRRETVCTDEPGGIKLTNNSEDLIRMDIIRKTERSQNEARRLLTYLQKIEGQYHGGIYKDEMQLLENYLVSYEDVIRTYTSRE